MDENGVLHIGNVIRGRMDGQEIVATMMALQKLYNPLAFGIEDTQITKALGPYLNRAMIEQNTYMNVIPMRPHKTDKITRAQSIRARMRAGGVKFDKTADWFQTLEDEMMSFPRSRHDDQVDALSYLGLIIDKIVEAPTKMELEEEEYMRELADTGSELDNGKSDITGY